MSDLKQRGLLKDTLAFSALRGFTYGASDELGMKAVEGRTHTNDLHATLLALMGINHKQLTYRYGGRDFRFTDVAGEAHRQIVS